LILFFLIFSFLGRAIKIKLTSLSASERTLIYRIVSYRCIVMCPGL